MERWQSEIAMLKHNIPLLQARARARRRAYARRAGTLRERRQRLRGARRGRVGAAPAFSNLSTTSELSLAGAGAGTRAGRRTILLLSFEYRNEGQLLGPMDELGVGFPRSPHRPLRTSAFVSPCAPIAPRTVRIDLDSLLYEAGVEGIKFGWEVAASSEPLSRRAAVRKRQPARVGRANGRQLPNIGKRVEGSRSSQCAMAERRRTAPRRHDRRRLPRARRDRAVLVSFISCVGCVCTCKTRTHAAPARAVSNRGQPTFSGPSSLALG